MNLRIAESLIILLLGSSAWGQSSIPGTTIRIDDRIISDTVNLSPNREFERQINLEPIDESDSDFEVRFYTLTVVRNITNLRIVKLTKGEWDGIEFDQKNKSKISRRLLSPTTGYESLVMKLIEHKLATLPDQKEVDKRIEDSFTSKKDALSARPSIMDGYTFTVEFRIAKAFRVYQFSNPETYARYYSKVEEFGHYVSILKVFEQDLVRK